MKTMLYISSLIWFVCGLLVLGLALDYEVMPLLAGDAAATESPQTHSVMMDLDRWLPLAMGAVWFLVFVLPSLFCASLAGLLGRLDKIHKTLVAEDVPQEVEKPPERKPTGRKLEPHIGDV